MDIIPSNVDLAGAEIELIEMDNRELALKKSLEDIKIYMILFLLIVRHPWDY